VMKEKAKLSPDTARCVEENSHLVEQAVAEIRTLSYLLHPPMLDELGLAAALKSYTQGFAERSKISVHLDLTSDLEQLPKDHELCLFRIAQECLTNVHRHSGSSTAMVRLTRTSNGIELEIKDEGCGLDKHFQARLASGENVGVGFRGMQERVTQIGGSLTVHSNSHGTSVLVALPTLQKVRPHQGIAPPEDDGNQKAKANAASSRTAFR
jgi:two-component system NarL family sensor kinase